ncbi:rhodanese-like domain-containing protein [Sediminibacterium soli]|uniref:rhodanese-like domain-containing protein n=1 Tax=Sediminibacterium soli TaxID=2698829 RepID=UPI00137A8440|nr:rhodanese-like domain-containing protein [Sediminibacterium soli]NCI47886.1 rhodanese-like domain-containing protein [Sediminibacterium soli]
MLQQLKNLFGIGRPAVPFKELVANGAQIIDVRTKPEYHTGHIAGSVNIPLQELGASLSRISKDKPVITCCASGMRSASAKSILRSQGFSEVHNGGGWIGLQNKIS